MTVTVSRFGLIESTRQVSRRSIKPNTYKSQQLWNLFQQHVLRLKCVVNFVTVSEKKTGLRADCFLSLIVVIEMKLLVEQQQGTEVEEEGKWEAKAVLASGDVWIDSHYRINGFIQTLSTQFSILFLLSHYILNSYQWHVERKGKLKAHRGNFFSSFFSSSSTSFLLENFLAALPIVAFCQVNWAPQTFYRYIFPALLCSLIRNVTREKYVSAQLRYCRENSFRSSPLFGLDSFF